MTRRLVLLSCAVCMLWGAGSARVCEHRASSIEGSSKSRAGSGELSESRRRCQGDLDRAATEAGIHRKSLERLLRQHGLKASDLK